MNLRDSSYTVAIDSCLGGDTHTHTRTYKYVCTYIRSKFYIWTRVTIFGHNSSFNIVVQ